jgi:protein-tyrosine-phosphatase
VVEEGAPAPVSEPPQGRHPLNVLFVCTANICRSPSAELLARRAGPDPADVVFASAGTHARDGVPIEPAMVDALPADLDTSGFRSRRLTARLLEDADLVVTMEAAHRSWVLDDHAAMFRKVFSLGQLAQAVEMAPPGLDREALLAHVAAARGHADPALDVADPYRRGPEEASGCVARLDALLRAVLPVLSR